MMRCSMPQPAQSSRQQHRGAAHAVAGLCTLQRCPGRRLWRSGSGNIQLAARRSACVLHHAGRQAGLLLRTERCASVRLARQRRRAALWAADWMWQHLGCAWRDRWLLAWPGWCGSPAGSAHWPGYKVRICGHSSAFTGVHASMPSTPSASSADAASSSVAAPQGLLHTHAVIAPVQPQT